jgi:hypothetical protein
MSSSTSDSDLAGSAARARAWGRWLLCFAATLVGGTALLFLFVVVVDPYSTGRLTPFRDVDIAISWHHLSNAGRVRDPQFDAAVFGNSRALRLDPPHLDELTGRKFVQLSVIATGPTEQFAVAKAFVRAHPGQSLMLLWGLDHLWCHGQDEVPSETPDFPYWLYGESTFEYLRHIFSIDAIQASLHRLGIRILHAPPAGTADGRPEPVWRGGPQIDGAQKRMRNWTPLTVPLSARPVRFPSIERLAEFVKALPANIQMVFFFPPYHISAVAQPDSPAGATLAACKAGVRAIADNRPGSVVVDWMRDGEVARDPENFWDETHPRDPPVRALESDIGRAIVQSRR